MIPDAVLKEVINLTGYSHQSFRGMVQGVRFVDVLTVSASFDLVHGAMSLSNEQRGLCFVDQPVDEAYPLESSLLSAQEDVPFKPETDVYVTGMAHAPERRPHRVWNALLRVVRPALPTGSSTQSSSRQGRSPEALISKALQLSGPRAWQHSVLGGWKLGDAQPTESVALRYELAYGGYRFKGDLSALDIAKTAADQQNSPVPTSTPTPTPSTTQLSAKDVQRVAKFQAAVQDDDCFEHQPGDATRMNNPSGSGYFGPSFERGHLKQGTLAPRAGPQISFVGDDVARERDERLVPAGWGPVQRFCSPRVTRQGRFDAAWLARANAAVIPDYPSHFDDRFFQYAPDDQRVPGYLWGHEQIELVGVFPDTPAISAPLPAQWIEVRGLNADAIEFKTWMNLDTVHVELDHRHVHLTWRVSLDQSHGIHTVVLAKHPTLADWPGHPEIKVASADGVPVIAPTGLYRPGSKARWPYRPTAST